MRSFLEAVPFSAAVPGAVGYAEGSYLSWVELLTSSSYSCLAAGLNPVCPTCSRASCFKNCEPPGLLVGGAGVTQVMAPLLCLGLPAVT